MTSDKPQAAYIEIVEKGAPEFDPDLPGSGVIRPNEIRINGTPLLCPHNETITIHEINVDGDDVVRVTLTLFARRVVFGADGE